MFFAHLVQFSLSSFSCLFCLIHFLYRQKSNNIADVLLRYKEGHKKSWVKPAATSAASATALNIIQATGNKASASIVEAIGQGQAEAVRTVVGAPTLSTQLPVLSSHCPGWVCFAEKTQPQAIPYMSSVKSSQQIMGTLLKDICLNKKLLPAGDGASAGADTPAKEATNGVFFVCIQPCFDKKLEASRLVRIKCLIFCLTLYWSCLNFCCSLFFCVQLGLLPRRY
jgi:iron only hydrogenase large subunit-like protein